MINTRYQKLTGSHAGQSYVVAGPYSEMDSPMRWELRNESDKTQILVVAENDLSDTKLWKSLG